MPSVVFISNYYTHHQSAFSEAMYKLCDGQYVFLETEDMKYERKSMGWEINKPDFIKRISDINNVPDDIYRQIRESDIVIIGNAPLSLVKRRLEDNKLTFLYSERIYKKGCKWYKRPLHILKLHRKFNRKSLYLLCASAYSSLDYSKLFCFKNKAYKWGYFPEVKKYGNIDEIIELKHPASILWVARLIELKHPELPVLVAKKLKDEGYKFELNMIGNGKMKETIKKLIADNKLQDCVHLLGSMKPNEVRKHMEESQIFMFTSDRNEGWGAVLNESMNSACAVVASHAIGSVPFLLEHEKNGLIYKDGDFNSLYNSVKKLLDDKWLCDMLGKEAYCTIINHWNTKEAARRLLKLSEDIASNDTSSTFQSGICSKASIIKNNWFK